MTEVIVIALLFVTLTAVVFLNYRLFIKKKRLKAMLIMPFSLSLFASIILFGSLILDKGTYDRLTKEHTIATISFEKVRPQYFKVLVEPAHSIPVNLEISGDQWQLDARLIKWTGAASYLGLQPLYSLERISGRYQSVKDEINKPRSVVAFEINDSFNYWTTLLKYQEMIPWLDAYYGNAVYLPMKDGAKFMVTIGQQGLIARPRNLKASQSVKNWQLPTS